MKLILKKLHLIFVNKERRVINFQLVQLHLKTSRNRERFKEQHCCKGNFTHTTQRLNLVNYNRLLRDFQTNFKFWVSDQSG